PRMRATAGRTVRRSCSSLLPSALGARLELVEQARRVFAEEIDEARDHGLERTIRDALGDILDQEPDQTFTRDYRRIAIRAADLLARHERLAVQTLERRLHGAQGDTPTLESLQHRTRVERGLRPQQAHHV